MILRTYPSPFWTYSNTSGLTYQREIVGDNIEVTIELPGMDKEDISLNYLSEKLSINLSIESKAIDQDIYLANQIDPEAITAKLEKGILKIVCPIKTNNRKISIQ